MPEISESTKKVIAEYAFWKDSLRPKPDVPTIHVDEVAMKVAAFYEKVRNVIDWREEHLMRRTGIIRKLKRRFLDLELNNFATGKMAEPLVMEFIRGGYFPNDKIAESKISEVQKIIEKYIFILRQSPVAKDGSANLQFYNQLLEIAACEIEETLEPSLKEISMVDFMFGRMKEQIKINENVYVAKALKKEAVDIQIYIAVQQALFKFDDPIISYNLIKYKFPEWEHTSEDDLFKIAQSIHKILKDIEQDLNHPLGKKFYAICEKYDTPYLLLSDILAREGSSPEKVTPIIQEPATLEPLIRSAYLKRLGNLKIKIRRTALYSTISIFVTKILSLVVLELFLAWITRESSGLAYIVVDILIPTLLMALLIVTIKPPSKKNLNRVIVESIKIVYRREKNDAYEIKLSGKRGLMTRLTLTLMYLGTACVSFGLIIWVFLLLQFPYTSIAINLIFIALILFAGTAIRTRAKELTIEEETGGLLGFLSDVFFLPITSLGRWLSNKWKRYNAVIVFFNVMIDMPFSAFVEFLERWRYFIQDRKEDLR